MTRRHARLLIVPERPGDAEAIGAVTRAAFRDVPHSMQTEAAIVDALRAAGAMTLSLVALEDDALIGHAALSPVLIDAADRGWFGLGPVSVAPPRQRCGIGSALIEAGLGRLRALGARGCVVLGEPDYYGRFGFRAGTGLTLDGAPPEYFQALSFGDDAARSRVTYHPGFAAA